MRKAALLLICFPLLLACNRQDPAPANNPAVSVYDSGYYTFPGQLGKTGTSAIVAKDGNLVLCGMNSGRGYIVKAGLDGSITWRKDHMVYDGTELISIAERSDGGYMLCGAGKTDLLVIATTASGERQWLKNYGDGSVTVARCIVRTADNNYFIAGHSSINESAANTDIFLMKINAGGEVLWRKIIETPQQELCYALAPIGNDVLVTGSKMENAEQRLYYLKLDATGNKLWEKTGTETYCNGAYSIESNGNIITCGTNAIAGYNSAIIIKADASGKMVWQKQLSEPTSHLDISSVCTVNDGFLLAGTSKNVAGASNPSDIFIAKLDGEGNLLWKKKLGGAKDDGACFITANNGKVIIAGNTGSYGKENTDGNTFILHTDNSGNIVD